MACKQNGNGSGGGDASSSSSSMVSATKYSSIIELNVGGVFYSTSLATLTSEPQSRCLCLRFFF